MQLFENSSTVSMRSLFFELYNSHTEQELEEKIKKHHEIFNSDNWKPLGENISNYGVVKNQQAAPIAALIEKITNSIDAILTRKCFEAGCDPKSENAPRSMEDAIERYFPDFKNWDLPTFRKNQGESIQILADGPRMNTSLTIYDDGEGQHPKDFEKTFLSLLRGNKNEIKFVQGKYNMGGSGAIIFCGKKRYQLIASKRYSNDGDFGFTLIREHPLTTNESNKRKETWYEYFVINDKIPSFNIDKLDLKLHNRLFETGTIIKLYSYDLPAGSRSVISRDLNQSINEYLFKPALPILTIDRKERYPDDRALERELYGLQRRLEQDDSKYIEDMFSEIYHTDLFGDAKVTCYVFKNKINSKSVKETKETIQREFFKNNMSVIFSLNGQVHGHYTSEFITRSLKMNLLKNHLLIHVDCTKMNYEFRKELFMASRDRLKDGEETRELRKFLANKLSAKDGRLEEIVKRRKDSIAVEGGDTSEILKSFTKNLPLNSDLIKLLNQTFKLDIKKEKPKKDTTKQQKRKKQDDEPFNPERFPTRFKLKVKNDGENPVSKIPIGGERKIQFETDVENNYFDRVEEPGELKIGLLNIKPNESEGGNKPGKPSKIEDVLNISASSPKDGSIKIAISPKEQTNAGDTVHMKVTLTNTGGLDFDEVFWVKIVEREKPKEPKPRDEKIDEDLLGLPEYILAYKEEKEGFVTWEKVSEALNDEMDYKTVIFPLASGDTLERIYINMDSNVLKSFKSKTRNANEEQLALADRKYISSVYFHTLFLYSISKNRKYRVVQENEGTNDKPIELEKYLMDIFESYYSEFILNFGGAEEMMQGLGD
jgi:hypothetical protein